MKYRVLLNSVNCLYDGDNLDEAIKTARQSRSNKATKDDNVYLWEGDKLLQAWPPMPSN